MSRARHEMREKRAEGGKIDVKPRPYNAEGSEVVKEAEEKNAGGRTGAKKKHAEAEGMMAKRRLDRPGRKRGGGIGADTSPLSTAARVKNAEGHDATEGNAADNVDEKDD